MGNATGSRSARYLAISGVGGRTMLLVTVMLLAIIAADHAQLRLDLSADHRFTIDPGLRQLLAQQTQPVTLVGIWGSEDERTTDVLSNDLQQMSRVNPMITWQHIDPDLNRPALEDFATRHGGARGRGLYALRGTRLYAIAVTPTTRLSLQRELGAALQVLADPHPPLAVFLLGHGELRPGGGGTDGCDAAMGALALGGFNVRTLEASSTEHLPADALLVLAGPRHDLSASGIRLVSDHLRDGGSVLAGLDDQAPADLCAYLHQRGVLVGTGFPQALAQGDLSALLDATAATMPGAVVYSWRHNVPGDGHAFPYPNLLLDDVNGDASMINGEHPASAAVAQAGLAVLSPQTSQVEAISLETMRAHAPAVAQRWEASALAPQRTTQLLCTAAHDAWRQRFGPDLHQPANWDAAPSYGLAWAVEYPPDSASVQDGQGGRLLVWGSRQAFADDALAHTAFANAEFLRSGAAWLVRRSPISTIPDTPMVAYHASLSEHGLFCVIFAMVIILPCLALGAAMLTWWDRR